MDQDNASDRAKADFDSKSGQPSQSPMSSQFKNYDPQMVKQEFVPIKQKVDALLDHLENFMKEPGRFQGIWAEEIEEEEDLDDLDDRIPKKAKMSEETEAENSGAADHA